MKYMQKIIQIVFIASAVTLASCGAKTDNSNAAVTEKKAKLEQLKKQQAAVSADITKLETELALLDPASAKEEKSKLVTITPITPVTFTHYIDLQGKIESENISFVTPRGGGGQVKELLVKRGDNVVKGQLLLKLDDAIAKQSVVAAEQGIETLKVQQAFAKNLYQKQKALWDQGIGTEVQLITAKNTVENLDNQLKSAQEQLKITKEQLQFTNVYSDVTGVAEEVNVKLGELFMGAGQIKIVNTSNLKVTTQIPENYIGRVNVGSHIKITLPDINKTIDASVTVSGKLIDANSRSFYVEAKIPSDKDFHPNQVALVRIQDYTTNNAITIPVNTLQTDEKGKYVMVAVKENGKMFARKKMIVTGQFYGDQMEVKSGLLAGDLVITDGYQSLYDGQLITTDVK
jgi:RND family efflux transporter MFP subunit